jgi:hypothetical protein
MARRGRAVLRRTMQARRERRVRARMARRAVLL